MSKAGNTLLIIGVGAAVVYLGSQFVTTAVTEQAVGNTDLDAYAFLPINITTPKGFLNPVLNSRLTLKASNPTNYQLKLTYLNLELKIGTSKFGEAFFDVSKGGVKTINAQDSRFLMDFPVETQILNLATNGVLDLLFANKLPDKVTIVGNAVINGVRFDIDKELPFVIPKPIMDWLKKNNVIKGIMGI